MIPDTTNQPTAKRATAALLLSLLALAACGGTAAPTTVPTTTVPPTTTTAPTTTTLFWKVQRAKEACAMLLPGGPDLAITVRAIQDSNYVAEVEDECGNAWRDAVNEVR